MARAVLASECPMLAVSKVPPGGRDHGLGPVPILGHKVRGYRQEGQGSPNGGNRLQVSGIFISLKRQEETN